MVLSFNKDDKNVGTMSERVSSGRHSLSVRLLQKCMMNLSRMCCLDKSMLLVNCREWV